jgi:hypothetical protein
MDKKYQFPRDVEIDNSVGGVVKDIVVLIREWREYGRGGAG